MGIHSPNFFKGTMNNSTDGLHKRVRFTLKKEERLCSKKLMDKLFAEGDSFLVHPLKVVCMPASFSGTYPAKAAFAVSKKLFKRAVDRNYIKRLLREAYRLNKQLLLAGENTRQYAVVFIYIGRKMPGYPAIEKSMKRVLSRLSEEPTPNP